MIDSLCALYLENRRNKAERIPHEPFHLARCEVLGGVAGALGEASSGPQGAPRDFQFGCPKVF